MKKIIVCFAIVLSLFLLSNQEIHNWIKSVYSLEQTTSTIKALQASPSNTHTSKVDKKSPYLRILAWGVNNAGQLGNSTKASYVQIPIWATEVEKILQPNHNILSIDIGNYGACLLRNDRTVWC